MSNKTTIVLALAAGFIGGTISQHIAPPPVYAQPQIPVPREIRAESFVIVDTHGVPRGAFAVNERNGWPMIEITDRKRHAWAARFQLNGLHWNAPPKIIPPQ